MVHLSDLDWQKPGEQALDEYNRGDIVKAKVLDVDVEKERISLGIKQLGAGEASDASGDGLKKGSVVTGTVTEVNEALSKDPGLINRSPYEQGWIVRIKLKNPAEAESLMDREKYDGWVKGGNH